MVLECSEIIIIYGADLKENIAVKVSVLCLLRYVKHVYRFVLHHEKSGAGVDVGTPVCCRRDASLLLYSVDAKRSVSVHY